MEYYDDESFTDEEFAKIKRDLVNCYTRKKRYEVFECENTNKKNDRRWYVWDNLTNKREYNGKLMTRADAKGRLTREKKSNVMVLTPKKKEIYSNNILNKAARIGISFSVYEDEEKQKPKFRI
jgi:hypothetical protein